MRFLRSLRHWQLLTIPWLMAVLWCSAGATPSEAADPPAAGREAPHAQIHKLNLPSPPRPGEPINDLALSGYLEAEGTKLVEAGRTLTNWSGLLGARTCSLKLPQPSSRKLPPTALARRVEAATAVVGTFYLCGKCSKTHCSNASGFFINESGAVVTCLHVLSTTLSNGVGMVVMTRDGRVSPVRDVLAVDTLHDLVVLQAQGTGFIPLPLARQDAAAGSPVLVVSNPNGHYYAVSTGVVARRGEQLRPGGTYHFLSITADFAKGSSGAPVCDDTGSVVGIVDNTQSIYYDEVHDQQQNFQMAVKNCSPAGELLRLVGKRPAK